MTGLTTEQVERFHEDGYLVVEGLISTTEVLDPLVREYEHGARPAGARVARRRTHRRHVRRPAVQRPVHPDRARDQRDERAVLRLLAAAGQHPGRHADVARPGRVPGARCTRRCSTRSSRSSAARSTRTRCSTCASSRPSGWEPHDESGRDEDGRDQLAPGQRRRAAGGRRLRHPHGVVLAVGRRRGARLPAGDPAQPSPRPARRTARPGRAAWRSPSTSSSRADALPLPTRRGDAIFLHKRTVHNSLSNVSDRIRWSFDLRYNPIGQETGRRGVPRLRRPQPVEPRQRAAQPRRLGGALVRGPRAHLAAVEYSAPFNRWSADAPVCA